MKIYFVAVAAALTLFAAFSPTASAATFQGCPDAASVSVPSSALTGYYTASDKSAASDAYRAGHVYGCSQGAPALDTSAPATLQNQICNNYSLTPPAYAGTWVSGCKSGVSRGIAVQSNNYSVASISLANIQNDSNKCSGLDQLRCPTGYLSRLADFTLEEACGPIINNDCKVGYTRAQSNHFGGAPSTKYPTVTIDSATEAAAQAINNSCTLDAYVNDPNISDPRKTEVSFQNGYKKGCVEGYSKAFTGWVYEDVTDPLKDASCKTLINQASLVSADQTQVDFAVGIVTGCKEGVKYAWQTKPPPTVPASDIDFAKNTAACQTANTDADFQNGFYLGCSEGYKKVQSAPDLEKSAAVNDCRTGKGSTSKYVRVSNFNQGAFDGCGVGVNIACTTLPGATCNIAPAGTGVNLGNTSGKGLVPNCDPKLPPSAPGGCGVNKLVELIKNIMQYLFIIVLPIAGLAIGYGGFQIMTSAGSEEKFSSGKNAIQVAIVGIVIMLASYFVVQAIFIALGVDDAFKVGGI